MSKPLQIHQTIIAVSVALGAIAGAATGVLASLWTVGALNGSDLLGRFALTGDATTPPPDKHITELIEEESATIRVVDRVVPGVVSIVIKKARTALAPDERQAWLMDPSTIDSDGLVEIGGGTGFFMSADGYVVTNRHVVSDVDAFYFVVTDDGAELPATVVAKDTLFDLAVLDLEGDNYPTVPLGDSDTIRIGQTVIAIGNTLSEYQNTVTKGVISGINRQVWAGDGFGGDEVIDNAIQTDAAINPGNSGGPLINLLGEVIGINTAVSFEGASIGFAIPVNDAKKIIEDVRQYGRIVRPWLGVRYVSLTPTIAKQDGLAVDVGAYVVGGEGVTAVFPGSPADAAGLRDGDIIASVGDQPVTDENPLGELIGKHAPGDVLILDVVRGEERLPLTVTLAELDPEKLK